MNEHYYTEKPVSKEDITKIKINLKNDAFELYSASGLFSKQELDQATKILIENSNMENSKEILDLGCGYGVVGISILRQNPALNMTFSDINERAIKITKKNIQKHKLKGKIIKSNLFDNIEEKFDTIISNPPYAAGRDICFKLIEQAFNHLKKEGTLQIVARHNKGGKILGEKIKEIFGNMQTLTKKSGFRIYQGTKK